MKIKLNITQNELSALLTALRIQKQELTEKMMFKEANDSELPTAFLMAMFDQTDNVYKQALSYASGPLTSELNQRDKEYFAELTAFRENLLKQNS